MKIGELIEWLNRFPRTMTVKHFNSELKDGNGDFQEMEFIALMVEEQGPGA